MLKTLLLPSFLLFAGLVLLGFAMLAPPARKRVVVPARERVRGLERVASTPAGARELRRALDDPDPQVAAVAAILLRDHHS